MVIDYDVIIVGCGPAGMNACLYASRSNLKTLVIERNCPGGKVVKTNNIENWIGTEKISGVDLALKMFKHSFSYGGVYEQGNVLDIIDYKDYKEVILRDKKYKCYAVIIAIGTSEKKLGIKGEEKFYGKGVSYCAVCDGALYKNKNIAVIGNDHHAVEEALYLTKYANKLYFVSEQATINGKMDELLKSKNVEILLNSKLLKIEGNEFVEKIIVSANKEEKSFDVSVVFPLIGDDPDTKFIERLKIVNDKNYVDVNNKKETSIEGIYAVGDCTNTTLRQITTACADGALAAIEVYKFIKNKKGRL